MEKKYDKETKKHRWCYTLDDLVLDLGLQCGHGILSWVCLMKVIANKFEEEIKNRSLLYGIDDYQVLPSCSNYFGIRYRRRYIVVLKGKLAYLDFEEDRKRFHRPDYYPVSMITDICMEAKYTNELESFFDRFSKFVQKQRNSKFDVIIEKFEQSDKEIIKKHLEDIMKIIS